MDREQLVKYILDKFPGKVVLLDCGRVEPFFKVELDFLKEFCRVIRDDATLGMDFLCNIGAVDTGEHFEVVYSVASVKNKIRFDFKIFPERENPVIDSIIDVWPGANWYEREVWELFGINVNGHPNLKRFLLPDDWNQGHPMRKDWTAPDFLKLPEN